MINFIRFLNVQPLLQTAVESVATVGASATVPRTTARSSVRTPRRSIAAAAPFRRVRRRRFPHRLCRSIGRPDRPGRLWISHPTHLWCIAHRAAHAASLVVNALILRIPARPCRAGKGASDLRRSRNFGIQLNALETSPPGLSIASMRLASHLRRRQSNARLRPPGSRVATASVGQRPRTALRRRPATRRVSDVPYPLPSPVGAVDARLGQFAVA